MRAYLTISLTGALLLAAQPSEPATLESLNWMVGEWNGVAQPKRGSAAGAWRESAAVQFVFGDDPAKPSGLELAYDGSELFETVTIRRRNGELEAVVAHVANAKLAADGDEAESVLPLASSTDDEWVFAADDSPVRLTVRRRSDIRAVVLVESRRGSRYRRVVEVGYTRDGERLAASDQTGPQCVVTGGRGTISVSHEGQTYYVCCSGCEQAFYANPGRILAAAKAKAAAKANANANDPNTQQ